MKPTRKVLDFLKVRASYGLLGNQNIGNYPYAATIATGYGYYLGGDEADKELVSGVAQTTLANSNISWEKSKQINFGIDFSLWNGFVKRYSRLLHQKYL
ncbi:TonB-dependent receptor [Bacteroides ovatus]|uniref:TonB-dependent receptor n=1 Tax=Bacteroides ovatus TaxID=28116 RepID=UPI0021654E76|nr:TonB-dependent receptor [Bacteroides ovatus]MCS3242749.1 TonB-dependent receptor [Bacteroides ovatus]